MQCCCCKIPEYLDKNMLGVSGFTLKKKIFTNKTTKVVYSTQSIRYLKKLFIVATDMDLELPVPNQRNRSVS